MKKIFLSFAIIGACSFMTFSASAQAVGTNALSANPQETTAKATSDIQIPDPPHFENEDVNKGVSDFISLLREYAPAIKSQDMSKMQEFAMKIQPLQQEMGNWQGKMSEDEQAQFMSYMQEVNKQLEPDSSQAKPADEN